ncbi:MAG: hypothetical protein ACOCZQ_03190 [Nanoarchaeota archaeon]
MVLTGFWSQKSVNPLIHCIPPVSDWCSMWYTMCSEGSDPSPKGEQAIGL